MFALLPLAFDALSYLAVGVTVASAITALTPTPAPDSLLGKGYRWIERAALVIGKAKQMGIVRENPHAQRIGDGIVSVARDIAGAVPAAAPVAPVPAPEMPAVPSPEGTEAIDLNRQFLGMLDADKRGR